MSKEYDYRNCQSLFGYAAKVHLRCGYRCQFCGCGGAPVDFALWRQFTVEHVIGKSQGGYVGELRAAVRHRFPTLSRHEQDQLVEQIDEANTVSACGFCNAMTSRNHHEKNMFELLAHDGNPADVLSRTKDSLQSILDAKRSAVKWKLASVRAAFDREINVGQ